MWRFIFIAAIFISAFLPSSGAYLLVCGHGFTLDGEVCRNKIPSYLVCPYPQIRDDHYAPCTITKQYCSFTDLGNSIPDSSLVELGCPEGYMRVWYMQACIKSVNHGDAEMKCEPECYERNGECMNTLPSSDSSCSSGTLVSESVYRCFTNETCPKRPHCQTGNPEVEIQNNQVVYKCIEEQRTPLGYYCPQGSGDLQNPPTVRFHCRVGIAGGPTGCRDTTIVDPVTTCPSGYQLVDDDKNCLRVVNADRLLSPTTTTRRPITEEDTAEGPTRRRMLKGLPSQVL